MNYGCGRKNVMLLGSLRKTVSSGWYKICTEKVEVSWASILLGCGIIRILIYLIFIQGNKQGALVCVLLEQKYIA